VSVRLVTFAPAFAEAFASLNYQWIEHYFAVEDEDRRALSDPIGYALEPGGEIFFVLVDDEPVGTVAMVPKCDGPKMVFELAKMAVRPDFQGQGYSRLLMDACLTFARDAGADEIMLVTNDMLAPALNLYKSTGFVAEARYSDQRYTRGTLQMRLILHRREANDVPAHQ
jgi:GNAT superfamily N-acetyltransferase